MTNAPLKVVDGIVVSLKYELRLQEDGPVVERSKEQAPWIFRQGQHEAVPGLERALYGMQVGEEKDFKVDAADGYGQIDPQAVRLVPRRVVSTKAELVPGLKLRLRAKSTGKISHVQVVDIGKDNVLLDFNHQFAGKTLYYHVRIVDLRPATQEELAQNQQQ